MQEYQKYIVYFIRTLMFLAIIFFIYIFITRLVVYILPFIIAWLIASIINPAVDYVNSKTKVPRGIISALLLLSLFTIFSFLIFLGASRLMTELSNISDSLPRYTNILRITIMDLVNKGQNIYINLPSQFTQLVNSSFNNIVNSITSIISNTIGKSVALLSFFPKTLIFVIVTIMASYFISRDNKMITKFILAQLPEDLVARLKSVEIDLLKALGGFIRAQLTIMIITFVITATGLYIIGIPYALTMALIIGLVDALPILGTGAILIPWSVINILLDNHGTGFALLVLYGIIVVTRQIIEPKIVGMSIGLHPLVALASLYIGIQIFGIIGIVLGPLTVIVVKALQKASILPNWKERKQP